jgi:hypothetical protein
MKRQIITLIFSIFIFNSAYAYYQIKDPINLSIDVKTNLESIFPNLLKDKDNSLYILIQPDIFNLGGSFIGEPQNSTSKNKIFNTRFENIQLTYKLYHINISVYNIREHKITSYLCTNGKDRLILNALKAKNSSDIDVSVIGLKNDTLICECADKMHQACYFSKERINQGSDVMPEK